MPLKTALARDFPFVGKAFSDGFPDFMLPHAINQVFQQIGWSVRLDDLVAFLSQLLSRHKGTHTFVSFNYDLVLDRAVELASEGLWQPRTGYGFEFQSFFAVGTDDYDNALLCSDRLPCSADHIRVLKPHGSLNWLRKAEKKESVQLSDFILVLNTECGVRYWPLSADPDYEFVIIPPMPQKTSLHFISRQEQQALIEAEEVFVIGYSMPETDPEQETLIAEAMRRRQAPLKRLIVVNNGAPASYFGRMQRLFNPSTFDPHNEGFIEFAQTRAS